RRWAASTPRRSTPTGPRSPPGTRSPPPARGSWPPRPSTSGTSAGAAAWCPSAPRAAWAWSRSSNADAGSAAQARHAVLVAFLDPRGVVDLLAQVAPARFLRRVAARGAQRIRGALARAGLVAHRREAVAEFFPGLTAGALRQRPVEVVLRHAPLALFAGDPPQRQQQRRAGGMRLEPALRVFAPLLRPAAAQRAVLRGKPLVPALVERLFQAAQRGVVPAQRRGAGRVCGHHVRIELQPAR